MLKYEEAEPFLTELGLSRKIARELISEYAGRLWRVIGGKGKKGDPAILMPPEPQGTAARNGVTEEPREMPLETGSILAGLDGSERRESSLTKSAIDAVVAGP